MNTHDEFTKQIISRLNQAAYQHPDQNDVAKYVLAEITPRKAHKVRVWAVGGLALAAALTGITVIPNFVPNPHSDQMNQAIVSPKLSPQMIEDLEMLSLLGAESSNYGS